MTYFFFARRWNRLSILSLASLAAVTLSGCSLSGTAPRTSPPETVSTAITGKLMGGEQAISGAKIELWVTGNAAYGTGATNISSLVGGPAYTQPGTGSFSFGTANIPANCTGKGAYAYLTATGGDPSGVNAYTDPGFAAAKNDAIKQVAVIGPCSTTGANTFVVINELTSVAAAYTLHNFATDSTTASGGVVTAGDVSISTSSTNAQGLADAVSMANLLVPSQYGVAGVSTAAVQLPTQMINTLSDIVEACVNSTGPTSSKCTSLMTAATPPTSTGKAPADTFQALMNIAAYPGNNVSTLMGISAGISAPFQPSLSYNPTTYAVQNDLTLGVAYTNGLLATVTANNPEALVVDGSDNIITEGGWSPFYIATIPSASAGGSESTQQAGVSLATSSSQIETAVVDASNNIWLGDNDNLGEIVEIPAEDPASAKYIYLTDPDGATPPYSSSNGVVGQNTWAITVDAGGNVWTSSYRSTKNCAATLPVASTAYNSVCEFQELPAAGSAFVDKFGTSNVEAANATVRGMVADANTTVTTYNGRVWATDTDTTSSDPDVDSVTVLTPSTGATITAKVYTSSSGAPTGIALDKNSNAWITNNGGSGTTALFMMPAALTSSSTGTAPNFVSPATISTAKQTPSASSGNTVGGLNYAPRYLAIDGAGNLFIANNNANSIVEYSPGTTSGTTTGVFLSPYYGFSPSFTSSSINIGGYAITSNVITMYAANKLAVGNSVTLSGFTGANTALNGVTLTVASASTSKFTANYTGPTTALTVAQGTGTVPTVGQTLFSCNSSGSTCSIANGGIVNNYPVAIDRAGVVWTLSSNGTVVGILGPGAPTNPLNSAGQYGIFP